MTCRYMTFSDDKDTDLRREVEGEELAVTLSGDQGQRDGREEVKGQREVVPAQQVLARPERGRQLAGQRL